MVDRLTRMQRKNSISLIGEVRGLGAMVAIELTKGEHVPAPDQTKAVIADAIANGLILLSCGVYGNVIRFLSPLTITDALLDEGLDILERSLEKVSAAA